MSARLETRRQFLAEGLTAVTIFIASCTPNVPRAVSPTETPKSKEQEQLLTPGNVGRIGDTYYMLRINKLYPFSLSEFTDYRRVIEFDRFGRKIVDIPSSILNQYELGAIPKRLIDPRVHYEEPFTGAVKKTKPKGGKLHVFFFGFMDKSGYPYTPVRPKDSFADISGAQGLGKNKWDDDDFIYATNGAKGVEEYDIQRAIMNPAGNIEESVAAAKKIIEDLPDVQLILHGHSLGSLPAVEIAKRFPEAVDAVFLYAAPVNGIPRSAARMEGVAGLKADLLAQGIDPREEVTEYFLRLYSEKRKEEMSKFAKEFRGMGKILKSWVYGGDPIVPAESTIDGTTVIGPRIEYGVLDIPKALAHKADHGAPLTDPKIIAEVRNDVGINLAA